jgi:hypothetical protein
MMYLCKAGVFLRSNPFIVDKRSRMDTKNDAATLVDTIELRLQSINRQDEDMLMNSDLRINDGPAL